MAVWLISFSSEKAAQFPYPCDRDIGASRRQPVFQSCIGIPEDDVPVFFDFIDKLLIFYSVTIVIFYTGEQFKAGAEMPRHCRLAQIGIKFLQDRKSVV